MSDDERALLAALHAHGQQFLSAFSLPESSAAGKKRKREAAAPAPSKIAKTESEDEGEGEYEEWYGIDADADGGEEGDSDAEDDSEEREDPDSDADDGDGFEQDDDDFTFTSSTRAPNVVVFADARPPPAPASLATKAQMKAFMSSKVSKLRQDAPGVPATAEQKAEDEDDRSNAQNDALLHRLVHTKLLAGAPDTELALTPAQRRKALAGRVLELAGGAKLGKGERAVRAAERNRAAKRVREGIVEKQKERGRQELEEAKNLGNYHPTLKRVYEAAGGAPARRTRERGLGMGVGRFSGGMLKLSREEISATQGSARGGARGRGRGGGRGGGGRGGKSRGRGRGK